MAKLDYYELLGVERSAGDKVIKSAFRKLAMKYHPDKNPGDAEAEIRFMEVSEAYERLKDPDSRAAYDRYGHAAFENGGGGSAGGFHGDFGASFSDIFDDLFGDFMGGQRSGRRSDGIERGSDLRYNMDISLWDAYSGKTAEIEVPTSTSCEPCNGTGAKPGTSPSPCSTCHGAGKIRATQGFFTIERTCAACQGRGEQIDNPCAACAGQGRVRNERILSVNIPAGVEDGTRIRVTGEGEAGTRGGPPGDLYIFLSISPHDVFQRDGADIFCIVPVSMVTAALGGSVEVPTVDGGRTKVTVPEGTQAGKQFRLKGKGMPVLRTQRHGDMYIQVTVETPQNLSKRQKELLGEFETLSSEETHPEAAGFFTRVKHFWSGPVS
ncbi:Chaperone protein DnaJ [hydrothermal vent metagenome]|uniref:Chaperone protein DnaJ n=1 Tax=hydrothermal vent metagenome TaxID=652676 RepID=A0A3B0TEZ6_9ZZZZ